MDISDQFGQGLNFEQGTPQPFAGSGNKNLAVLTDKQGGEVGEKNEDGV